MTDPKTEMAAVAARSRLRSRIEALRRRARESVNHSPDDARELADEAAAIDSALDVNDVVKLFGLLEISAAEMVAMIDHPPAVEGGEVRRPLPCEVRSGQRVLLRTVMRGVDRTFTATVTWTTSSPQLHGAVYFGYRPDDPGTECSWGAATQTVEERRWGTQVIAVLGPVAAQPRLCVRCDHDLLLEHRHGAGGGNVCTHHGCGCNDDRSP